MTPHAPPTHRTVALADALPLLRVAVGLRSTAVPPAPSPPPPAAMPPDAILHDVDADAWLAWSLAGLRLFAAPQLPTWEQTATHARHVLLSLAVQRSGRNISGMARWLDTSRRWVREHLRALERHYHHPATEHSPANTTTQTK